MVSSFENFDSKFHLLTYKPHQNESRAEKKEREQKIMADFDNVGRFLLAKIQSKESSKASFEKYYERTDSNVGKKILEKMGWKEGEFFIFHL